MVFCFDHCSDLLWETIVLTIEKDFYRFDAEGREFAKILRWLEKSQNNFWNGILLNLLLKVSIRSSVLEQLKCQLKKIIGYRNMSNKQTLSQIVCIQQLFFLKVGELGWARKKVISLSKS